MTFSESNCNWVRRSSRQPSKSLLNSSSVRDLVDKLKSNDSDMVVLKMKKYLNDPDIAPVIMNAALEAMEENSNCQALFIQVRESFVVPTLFTTIFPSRLYPKSHVYFCITAAFFVEFQQSHA